MPSSLPALDTPFSTVDDVVLGISLLEADLRARRDRRSVFATAYLAISLEMRSRLQAGFFLDNDWVARYLVAFANLYRQAWVGYAGGLGQPVPKAWRISFETSASGRGLVMQDLLLGLNAHINYDLPLALLSVGIDPDRAARLADHTAVNLALRDATDPLQLSIARYYAPLLRLLDEAARRLDEEVSNFSIEKARQASWLAAVSLVNAQDEAERQGLRASLDDRTAVLARLMLHPRLAFPGLWTLLRLAENLRPWWSALPARSLEV
jgi:hypothetical protein